MNLTASARLIMKLGEQLIEDELVALLELIKNAYDADANNVDVVIDTETVTPYGKGRIEIKDDGNGMIPSIVRNSFLRLSTSFKEEEKSSIYYHRRVLGKKGIGRLSFQRLGNYISVETVPNIERYEETELLKEEDKEFIDEYSKINIDIDWSEFPIDMDFSDIMAMVKYEKDVVASYGTKIVIQGIKNLNFWDMDKKKEEKLKNELLNMMDPFQKNLNLKKSERFNVLLKINDVPYSVEPIDESLLDELYDSKVSFEFKEWKLFVKIERPLKYIMQRRNSLVKKMKESGFTILHEADYEKDFEEHIVDFSDLNKVSIDYPKIDFTIERTTFLSEGLLSKLEEKKETGKITEEEYKEVFGSWLHPFTGLNMVDFYRELVKNENCEIEFVFANDPKVILNYTKDVLTCDIHTREKTKKLLIENGENNVYNLTDVLNEPINNSGFNPKYGLLGSNKSTEERLKLFPKTGDTLVHKIQDMLKEKTGKTIEVMVYGDGAFKDPVGHIWELADPVVSPAYTSGLEGTPNELKLKYISDNKFKDLRGDELKEAIKNEIREKNSNLVGNMASQGTTPRRLTDLIGSLCDLTSGSGDKGTPVVFIQGYFDNLSDE